MSWLPTAAFALCSVPGLAVLSSYVGSYLRHSWSIISFPYGYGGSPELMRAIAVAHAHFDKLYEFWNDPPYHMANYPFLFPLINGVLVHFFGVQYQSGRLLAWTSSLLFIAVISWLAWREAHSPFTPLVSVLLWFSTNYVWNWTPMNREDEVAMLFSILGLLIFYEGYVRRQRSERAVWLALPLFLAAIYTRQTTIEAAAACGLYLLAKHPALVVKWTLVFAAAAGGLFVLVDILTQGAFYLNVIAGNLDAFQWSTVAYFGHQFWDYYQVGPLLAIFFLITQIALRRQQVFSAWLLITFAVAVTIGKIGSAENYLLLPWGATCLCAGAAAGRLHTIARWLWRRHRLPLLPQLAGLVLALPLGFLLLLHAQLAMHIS
ncbi:MAG: hypothetical protein M1118_11085 [Chloroflexi bacterium]|nr:hypothetical protein [Chloroflexota bacterium]